MATRSRPTSTLPKAPTSLHRSCTIADTAVLTGLHRITVGANAIIHPRARVLSTYGPVTIGEGCVVSERATIGTQQQASRQGSDGAVTLGKNVVVEPAATVEAVHVGEGTRIEVGAKIGGGTVVGKHCKITPLSCVRSGETLPDFSVVYGENERRTQKPGLESLRQIAHEKQLEVMRKLIPSNLAKFDG